MARIDDIERLLQNALAPLYKQNADLNTKLEKIENAIETYNNSNDMIQTTISRLEKQLKNKEKLIEKLDMKTRERNLLIFGVTENKNENVEQTVIKLMGEELKINLSANDIEGAIRIGRSAETGKSRPIFVELNSKKIKKAIFMNSKALKGTNIFLEHDFPKEMVETRKALRTHLRKAKQEGNRAFLSNEKLIINGTPYSLSELEGFQHEKEDRFNQEEALPRRLSNSFEQIHLQREKTNDEIEIDYSVWTPGPPTQQTKINETRKPANVGKWKIKGPAQMKGPLDKHVMTRARSQSTSKNRSPKNQ